MLHVSGHLSLSITSFLRVDQRPVSPKAPTNLPRTQRLQWIWSIDSLMHMDKAFGPLVRFCAVAMGGPVCDPVWRSSTKPNADHGIHPQWHLRLGSAHRGHHSWRPDPSDRAQGLQGSSESLGLRCHWSHPPQWLPPASAHHPGGRHQTGHPIAARLLRRSI